MAGSSKAGERSLARVWSDAVFRLAASRGVEDAVLEEWRGLVELLDRDRAIEGVLASPLVNSEEKRRLIENGFRGKASDLFVDTLQVMRSKGRLFLIRAVAEAFRDAWMENKNQVEVNVTSAVALTPELRANLVTAASRFAGKQAQLVERVDPTLLGGLVVRVGDKKFDDSVARELEQLQETFLARASRELLSGREYVNNSEESSRGV
ncbi:MAG: ATP synthase F1 subunit delta [Thermoanaerobaculia bacterium]